MSEVKKIHLFTSGGVNGADKIMELTREEFYDIAERTFSKVLRGGGVSVDPPLGINALTKIPAKYFRNIRYSGEGQGFLHFNRVFDVSRCAPPSGSMHVILPIVKMGTSASEPLLSLRGALLARCVSAITCKFEKLAENFPNFSKLSLVGLNSPEGVRDFIHDSYIQSRGLTEPESGGIWAEGVGVTLFELIARIPPEY